MIPLAVPAQTTGDVVVTDDTYTDFANGTYMVNGATVTDADVVDNTGRISGSGLSFVASDPVQLLGDFRDALLSANFTVVVEYEITASPQFGGHRLYLLDMFDLPEGSEFTCYLGFLFPVVFENNLAEVPDQRELFGDDGASIGIGKTAFTRIDAQLSVSTNGGTVNTETTSMVAANFVTARIGEHNGTGTTGYIRRIDVLAPVDDVDLPGLSA